MNNIQATHEAKLRQAVLDLEAKRILIADFRSSDQEADLQVPPNCDGLGRVHHFKRYHPGGWPANPLPIDPACRALGVPPVDEMEVQVYQLAACNWHCWYCYVPYDLRTPTLARATWVSATELLGLYLREKCRPAVIDLTGGNPELVPEWVLWMIDAVKEQGMEDHIYLWSDDNLSTDLFWTALTNMQRDRIASYQNYGRVGCFKGICQESFTFNTGATSQQYERQFELMRRLIDLGLDQYAYVTFTAPLSVDPLTAMPRFIDRLQEVDVNLPLRTVPLDIYPYTPTQVAMNEEMRESLTSQHRFAEVWCNELDKRFTATERSLNIADVPLRGRVPKYLHQNGAWSSLGGHRSG